MYQTQSLQRERGDWIGCSPRFMYNCFLLVGQLSPLQHCHVQRACKPEQKEPSWIILSARTSECNPVLMLLLPCKSLERAHQWLSHKTRSTLPDGWPKPKWIWLFLSSHKKPKAENNCCAFSHSFRSWKSEIKVSALTYRDSGEESFLASSSFWYQRVFFGLWRHYSNLCLCFLLLSLCLMRIWIRDLKHIGIS